MFKKILLTSAIMMTSAGVAMATPAPYVGASLGINVNTTSSAANSQAANFRGVPFSLFAGYGGVVSQSFYLAGELTGTAGTAELSNNNSLKTTYGYGASVIPGVMLSDHTLAFARGGFVRSRFSNQSKSVSGGQLGLGLQTSLTQNLDLRGEYDFTGYKSVNVGGARISAPRADAFNLGLVYKFE